MKPCEIYFRKYLRRKKRVKKLLKGENNLEKLNELLNKKKIDLSTYNVGLLVISDTPTKPTK